MGCLHVLPLPGKHRQMEALDAGKGNRAVSEHIKCHCGATYIIEMELLNADGSSTLIEAYCTKCQKKHDPNWWRVWKAVLDIEHEQDV